MKTLKVCRIVSMIAFVALFIIELVIQTTMRYEMNWWIIAIIAVLAILAPINLRYSTKRERNPFQHFRIALGLSFLVFCRRISDIQFNYSIPG